MHSKSDKIEVVIYANANKVMKEIFESLLSRYQVGLETSIRIVILSLMVSIYCNTNVVNKF